VPEFEDESLRALLVGNYRIIYHLGHAYQSNLVAIPPSSLSGRGLGGRRAVSLSNG